MVIAAQFDAKVMGSMLIDTISHGLEVDALDNTRAILYGDEHKVSKFIAKHGGTVLAIKNQVRVRNGN